MKKTINHVVWNLIDKCFECKNCGAKYSPAMPVPIDMFIAMSKAFNKDHKRCKSK